MQRPTAWGERSILAPRASSRSADPDSPVAERLPCLATAQPAPAAISAAVVETLNVRLPPPVPAVSSSSSRPTSTRAATVRMAWARPAISCTVSPLVRSAMRNAPIWISETLPAMISPRTLRASSKLRSRRSASASIARVRSSALMSQEVGEQLPPAVGEDRLGVELHPLGRQLAVADRHHHPLALPAALQAGGQRRVRHQRVVAPDPQRRGQAGEDRAAVVVDPGRLAVHRLVLDHPAPPGLDERLVAQADAEGGDARLGKPPDRL